MFGFQDVTVCVPDLFVERLMRFSKRLLSPWPSLSVPHLLMLLPPIRGFECQLRVHTGPQIKIGKCTVILVMTGHIVYSRCHCYHERIHQSFSWAGLNSQINYLRCTVGVFRDATEDRCKLEDDWLDFFFFLHGREICKVGCESQLKLLFPLLSSITCRRNVAYVQFLLLFIFYSTEQMIQKCLLSRCNLDNIFSI